VTLRFALTSPDTRMDWIQTYKERIIYRWNVWQSRSFPTAIKQYDMFTNTEKVKAHWYQKITRNSLSSTRIQLRFQNIRKYEAGVNLFLMPFDVNIETFPAECQMEKTSVVLYGPDQYILTRSTTRAVWKSLWTHLITPSWNRMEVRWQSLFQSTSFGKWCTSYNAPRTSRKRAADRLLQASGG
jgi:hypothetical protein